MTRVGGLGVAGSSGTRKPVSPWALRSPAVERRFANGRTGGAACNRARSSGGIASANAPKSASSYSSTAAVRAHQRRVRSRPIRVLSQVPPAYGLRSPRTVASIAPTRPAMFDVLLPT